MMSWTLVGSNRFFLIFVSFDQAKERRKEEESLIPSPSPKEKGVLIQVKRIIISSYYSSHLIVQYNKFSANASTKIPC
jgi:hypothetical protein